MKTSIMAFLIATTATAVVAQERSGPTLTELAHRSTTGHVDLSRSRELVLLPIEMVIPRAELIVYGRVESVTTHLASNEMDLFSDCVVVPLRVVHRKAGAAIENPLVVRRWGGSLTIDGVQVTQHDLDVPLFEKGQELVLLLNHDASGERYGLTSLAESAFLVQASRLVPALAHAEGHEAFNAVRGLSVGQFESAVNRLVAK